MADADPPDEVDDVEAPADRDVDAPDADAVGEQVADRRRSAASSAARTRCAKPSHQPRGVLRVRTIALILSVTERERVARRDDRRVARVVERMRRRMRRIAFAHDLARQLPDSDCVSRGQVRRPRPRVQLVRAARSSRGSALQLRRPRLFGSLRSPKTIASRRAGRLAGGHDLAVADRSRSSLLRRRCARALIRCTQ